MATVIIDGAPAAPPINAETFADLIAAVDRRLETQQRLVTLLRIDGVEVPAFRDPLLGRTPAHRIGRVELESAAPGELATACLREAAQALTTLAAAAESAALAYRMEAVSAGSSGVVELTRGIGAALAVIGAASLGMGVDIIRIAGDRGAMTDVIDEASRSLEALVAAQQAGDWDASARELADRMAPLLRRWAAACGAIDLSRRA